MGHFWPKNLDFDRFSSKNQPFLKGLCAARSPLNILFAYKKTTAEKFFFSAAVKRQILKKHRQPKPDSNTPRDLR
jgi:hypothetical protein